MPPHPNLLFILIDDMGWKDLSISGSEFYETPNIDRIAREGMRFTDAYASCPVCSPTRASVMTGKYPAKVGITDWIDWGGKAHPRKGRLVDVPYLKGLPDSETTLAQVLKEQGYSTWHVGKWHLGGEGSYPQDRGFDVNVGGCERGSPAGSDGNGYFYPWSIPVLKDLDLPEDTYLTDYLTDQVVNLIEKQEEGTPFFLNLWYYTVHTPIQAKEEKIRKYEQKRLDLGLDKVEELREGELMPYELDHERHVIRRLVQSDPVYAAMIESLDENIGRILQTLEDKGVLDNTLIVFTSDNGGLSTAEGSPTCNTPLAEGKGWMYEGGTREPLFVRWPETITPGSTCETPVTTPDFFPTLLEAAGGNPADHSDIDGVSLIPLFKGESALPRDAIFWHYPHYGNQGGTPGASVRMGDYKLIWFFEDNHVELYNLREDIGETTNLAATEPIRTETMIAALQSWQHSIEARIPQPNPDWER